MPELPLQSILIIAAAPFFGSFIATVARRLPAGSSIVFGRSRCPYCQAVLSPRDLVPVLSWALAKGRCRLCGHSLGGYYPAVELIALAIAAVAVTFFTGPWSWVAASFGWALLALAAADADSFTLPDSITLPLIPTGLAAAWGLDPDRLLMHALAAVGGFVCFAAITVAYRAIRHRDGLGWGDAKLMAAAGAWVGPWPLPSIVLAAALAALSVVAVSRLRGRSIEATEQVPLGLYLAPAIWAAWVAERTGAL